MMPTRLSTDRTAKAEDGSAENGHEPSMKTRAVVLTSLELDSERRRQATAARGRNAGGRGQRPVPGSRPVAASHRWRRRRRTVCIIGQELLTNTVTTGWMTVQNAANVIGAGATISCCMMYPLMLKSPLKALVGTAIKLMLTLRIADVVMASCGNVVRVKGWGTWKMVTAVMNFSSPLTVVN
jgi:hypothetical protein